MANHPDWKETFKTFTKGEARDILGTRIQQQRKLQPNWVNALSRKMDLGLWNPFDPSQSPIAFDRNRNLINGQHRLQAFVLSKMDTLTVKIMTGCAPEDFSLFDHDLRIRAKAAAHPGSSNVARDQARIRHTMSLRMGDRHLIMTEPEFEFLATKTYRKELAFAAEAIPKAGNIGRAPFVAPMMYAYRTAPEFFVEAANAWAAGDGTLPKAVRLFRDSALAGTALPRDGGGKTATVGASLRMLNALAIWHQKGTFPKRLTTSLAGLRYFSERLRDGAATTWGKQVVEDEGVARAG